MKFFIIIILFKKEIISIPLKKSGQGLIYTFYNKRNNFKQHILKVSNKRSLPYTPNSLQK